MLEALLAAQGARRHARGAARARVGRAARPALQHRPHDGDDAAPQARRPAADRDGPRERLPRVIPALRVRLTALYGGIFVVFVGAAAGRLVLADGAATSTARSTPARPTPRSRSSACSTCSRWPARRSSRPRSAGRSPGASCASMPSAFDARERFVANATHELRSPLTVIRTEADVTLADPDADVGELRAMGDERARRRRRDGRAARRPDGARAQPAARCPAASRSTSPRSPARRPRARARRRRARAARARARRACSGERRLLERLAGEPDRERRPLQRARRLRRRAHARAADGRAVLDVVNSGPPSTRRVAARLIEPFERGGRTATAAAPGSGSRSCARSPRRTAAASRSTPRARGRARGATWCCRGRKPRLRGNACAAAGVLLPRDTVPWSSGTGSSQAPPQPSSKNEERV